MKILFVCRGNVGRSQAAMEYYRQSGGEADSAGTDAADSNIAVGDIPGASGLIEALKEDGIDITQNHSKPVTEELAARFDKIISMAREDLAPDWLKQNPKYVFWEIPEVKDLPLLEARTVRDHIKAHVQKLVDSQKQPKA